MGFLSPIALVGLLAASLPILIHLLGRRPPVPVPFPAVRYLTETERVHSRRLKLRNLFLLLLRTLVILFLVLAAAGPFVRVGSGETHAPVTLGLVIDNSISSGAVTDGRRVLDLLKERARQIAAALTEDDAVWIIDSHGVPVRVRVADLSEEIDSLEPENRRMDLGHAVRTAARSLGGDRTPPAVLVVLSDLQKSALSAGEDVGLPVLALEPPLLPSNRSLAAVEVIPEVWSEGGGEVAVTVGGDLTEGTTLALELSGRVVAQSVVASGETAVLTVDRVSPGWSGALLRLDPDEFRADDRYWLALRSVPPAGIASAVGSGPFVAEALEVLVEGGRLERGPGASLGSELGPGPRVVFPPADANLVGDLNRQLEAVGVPWRLGPRESGEWQVPDWAGPGSGSTVLLRHRLEGEGEVLVAMGGVPWLVRQDSVVILGSRLEPDWTDLPTEASFVPFVDFLASRATVPDSWIARVTPAASVDLPRGTDRLLGPGGVEMDLGRQTISAPADVGVYFAVDAAGDTLGAMEVNHDPRESQLVSATRAELRAAVGNQADLVSWSELLGEIFVGAGRADLSTLFLLLALGSGLGELALASQSRGTER